MGGSNSAPLSRKAPKPSIGLAVGGLGLTIVHNLVRLAGGNVTANRAEPSQGSEFVVRSPDPISPDMTSPPSEPPTPAAARQDMDILVVDDNLDALEMLVEALNVLGYCAYPANDVESALAVAREHRPSLALLDIGLPGMDGYQLGQRLRELPGQEDMKLVALTGYGQASDREKSHSLGFAAHLVKPIDLDRLSALLLELAAQRGDSPRDAMT